MRRKLQRSFFDRPTLEVGRDLIGKYLVSKLEGGAKSARIVEVEAYIGEDDPASHAAPGPTRRNEPMYGKPGMTYVYFIYGMYHCLNIVTEGRGMPAALLIRAAEAADGFDVSDLSVRKRAELLSGPGRLCRGFGLTIAHNNMDLTGPDLYLEDRGEPAPAVARSTRIGITKGMERPWRLYDADSASVSGKQKTSDRATKTKRKDMMAI